jgi:hypothetical protein
MKKNAFFTLILLILASACQKMQVKDYSDGIIHSMINYENDRLLKDKKLKFIKNLSYNGSTNFLEVSPHEIFKLDSALLALNPDKFFNHKGYNKSKKITNGLTEVKLVKKQDESSPIRMMDCYYFEKGDSLYWKALYIEKEDKNILFHNIQTYILDFTAGQLSDITMHTMQKSLFGKVQDFRVGYVIRKK